MHVIDSHTGGQPTRVIVEGGPELGSGSLSDRREIFAQQYDRFRTKCVLEPKCSDAMVGALLCEPVNPKCSAGVIFFNTSGYLGMCGHGIIGLIVTLAYLGRIKPGEHLIETPVGIVKAELIGSNEVRFENVESYCLDSNVVIDVVDCGRVSGSVVWGGNWFFLADNAPCALNVNNIPKLKHAAMQIKKALSEQKITGSNGAEIDHIEFFETLTNNPANSRNFVLCPGGAYDRSPCGTGTSAKMACLAATGALAAGDNWLQESIIGSVFSGSYKQAGTPKRIIPTITGSAFVYGETTLVFNALDPFRWGII